MLDTRATPEFSVVIAVFNSAPIISETVARVHRFFRARGTSYEVILVNDASLDNSWQILVDLARRDGNVVVLNMKKNMGEHAASLCGIANGRGRFIITMDDDLQTDPDDIAKLIAISQSNDVVFARFGERHSGRLRRWGGYVMRWLIRRIISNPSSLYVSSFRLFHRDTAIRMLDEATARSNINCLALLCAKQPGDVPIEERPSGRNRSNYNMYTLTALMVRTIWEHANPRTDTVLIIGGVLASLCICIAVVLPQIAYISVGIALFVFVLTLALTAASRYRNMTRRPFVPEVFIAETLRYD